MESKQFAFGHWPSPVTAASVAEGALRFGRVQAEGDAIYWSEGRPAEKGRAPVMRWTREAGVSELLPAPYSARSRVHEYGGGEFLVAGGTLFFVNDADQDVYAMDLAAGAGRIRRLTNLPQTRFADFAWDGSRNRLIAVGETHDAGHGALPRNALWTIPAGEPSAGPTPLLEGHDFYASPRISANGDRLAFLAWDLPAMPWDAARLFVAGLANVGHADEPQACPAGCSGEVSKDARAGEPPAPGDAIATNAAKDARAGEPVAVAGGDGSACFQPEWGADGTLFFVWDAGGCGQLWVWREGSEPEKAVDIDGDLSMPQWSFNAASYALLPEGRAYCTFVRNGEAGAAIAQFGAAGVTPRDTGFSAVHAISVGGAGAVLEGLKDDEALCIALDDPAASAVLEGLKDGEANNPVAVGAVASPVILRRSTTAAIDAGYISRPRRLEIPTRAGPIHGLLYPPQNPAAHGPAGTPPPMIVSLHGGPTSAAARGLKPRTQFFTSRGFAWLDLDYAGSVGYGRAYRERLTGNWGVADVEDTIAAAEYPARTGLADPDAIFVTGGSAGGYTVLMAIATANVFRGAASHYGVCDLIALQNTTHKFEQGYQQTLLGASLAENEAVYRERSPIQHIERISTPLILFQGADDNVVPKGQSIAIAEALRAKGVPVEYHEFAGEGHGFRQADTIRTCLERELAFYLGLMG
jgi:dienelactone hydrolase